MKEKKKWVILGILLVGIVMMFVGCKKSTNAPAKTQTETSEKTYRNVKILETDGKAVLTREKKEMAAYAELVIKGGDKITTGTDGMVAIRMDDDKYAKLGANSEAKFELEGDAKKGAIRIHLSKGSVYNEIKNPLSDEDCYEIHTPDGVMAVRGTSFDVIILEVMGKRETHVITHSGKVYVKVANSDGEEVDVEAGEEVIIDEGEEGTNGQKQEPSLRKDAQEIPENPETTETSSVVTPTPATPTRPTPTPATAPTTPTTPTETKVLCPLCSVTVVGVNDHKLSCGIGTEIHYTCDSLQHTSCDACGQLLCNKSIHSYEACGMHYPCAEGNYDGHEKMECQHYMCEMTAGDGSVIHEKCIVCNEWACQSSQVHNWAECGCVYCGQLVVEEHNTCEYCYSCTGNGQQHGDQICNLSE